MTIEDFSESSESIEIHYRPQRPLKIFAIFRLGLFNLGLGLMAVLTLAVLNRVMISELDIPGTITGGILATSLFVSPARVWFGQLSDRLPILGKHRTNYVLLGAIILGLAVFMAVQVVWQLGAVVESSNGWEWNSHTIGWSALLALVMAIYGLGVSCSSTPFTALLVDITEEEQRSRLVAIIWSMLMVGIVIGGITGSIVFKKIDPTGIAGGNIPLAKLQPPINTVFSFVPFLILSLAVIATWGIEKRYSSFTKETQTNREDSITLSQTLRILGTSRQTAIFFTFLCFLSLGLFLQEAILEPYGGEVFRMSIGETTLLNSFWGIGILVGYSLTGFLIIPRLGKKFTTKIGCVLVAISLLLIVVSGFTQQPMILKLTLILFGIAAGIATVGAISLMLDLTATETAGTFIGAWGLAQAMSRGLATFMGGVILDLGKGIFGVDLPLMSYGLVFAIQAIGVILAMIILAQVNVQEFKDSTNKALATVMEGDL